MERKTFRFSQRANASASSSPNQLALTPEDEDNLRGYVDKIEETIEVLEREIQAIKGGDLGIVSTVFDEKARLLKWLELQTTLVEPFINQPIAQELEIKHHLSRLKKYVEEDSTMLSRMAVAARTILREVEKISNRNELDGNYGKLGQRVSGQSGNNMRVDQKY